MSDISRKKFIIETDQHFFASLPLFFDILDNICIVIISFSIDDAINFESNLPANIYLFKVNNRNTRLNIFHTFF